ncbi:uncharacterized protein MYCGRDRAFT_106616 [Zymoseptoria tritici IPO323]|uniref:Uncharacterized protein n=1 Tax=Zymoseptoria tritici (strain CBS 115943 / IPO323) TaxID=336722 RepID=F9XQW3_ZYMTI|nr:uncharacterized protein MYCGRDRAFT_106616 [Zymoseptoria tritici IPO323]EGP82350.1 hypothetical protein MYCGRDRAFT_106616 [Zymoseptoria tritici IPO323]
MYRPDQTCRFCSETCRARWPLPPPCPLARHIRIISATPTATATAIHSHLSESRQTPSRQVSGGLEDQVIG